MRAAVLDMQQKRSAPEGLGISLSASARACTDLTARISPSPPSGGGEGGVSEGNARSGPRRRPRRRCSRRISVWRQRRGYRRAACPASPHPRMARRVRNPNAELKTPAGPIDNFMVTPSGLPVLVECKLWRNPEARRQVVGQILDYAKELSRWQSKLSKKFRGQSRKCFTGNQVCGDRADRQLPPGEVSFCHSGPLRCGRCLRPPGSTRSPMILEPP